MAQNRPEKPDITLPDDFGGTQTPFDEELVENGYEPSIPQVVEGGNLNWFINGFFQNIKYVRTVLDYVRDTPIGKMFWVNQNGQMDYVQPAIIATDTEFNTGTATDKTPNVKQVVDKINTKQATITGAASTITSANLTHDRVLISNSNGKVAASSTTNTTELGYLAGVTSAIQSQINSKANDSDVVKLSGNQTVAGTKTFSTSPILPTPVSTDNSTKGATTAFVKSVTQGFPDWTARVSITPDYTFTNKGFLLAWQYTIAGQAAYLNGQEILRSEGGHDYLGANYNTIFIPVDVGDELTGTVTGAIFMPYKGA